MKTVTLTMKRKADREALDALLDRIRATNRMFTIEFVKQNGEPRIINGIAKNYRQQEGTGTQAMTAKARRESHNQFGCYEVQITGAERALVEQGMAEPKTLGFKGIQVDNIERILFEGTEYRITGNRYVFKPNKVAEYVKSIKGNWKKLTALNSRTSGQISA